VDCRVGRDGAPFWTQGELVTAEQDDVMPRGADTPASQVLIYRVKGDDQAELLDGRMAPSDELAFAYINARGLERLMIFAVDEHQHVYWYYPQWTDAADNPRAVPIGSGPDLHELPEAVAQEFDGETLTIHYLFTNTALSVRDIERQLEQQSRQFPNRPGDESAATLFQTTTNGLPSIGEAVHAFVTVRLE
jgi:hypothetical protein